MAIASRYLYNTSGERIRIAAGGPPYPSSCAVLQRALLKVLFCQDAKERHQIRLSERRTLRLNYYVTALCLILSLLIHF